MRAATGADNGNLDLIFNLMAESEQRSTAIIADEPTSGIPEGLRSQSTDPARSGDELRQVFDEEYFRNGCGDVPYSRDEPKWTTFFGTVADQLIRALKPRKVLDAGCALGFLVEAFWDRGVEAQGIDISRFAIANVRRDMQAYCRVGSIAERVDGSYDLITCIEVLEHMPEDQANAAIRNLTAATDTILFSSTPYDVAEPTHINVRPHLSWLQSFQDFGFSPDLDFDASFLAPQAMLLRRRGDPLAPEVLRLFGALLHQRYLTIQESNRANEATKQLHDANVAISSLQLQLSSAQGEITSLRAEHSTAVTACNDAAATLQQRNQVISQLEQQASAARARAEALEHERAVTRQSLDQARNDLERARDELDDANAVILALRESHEDALDQLLAANRMLMKSETGAASELADIRRELQNVEARVAAADQRSTDALQIGSSIMQSRIWRLLAAGGGIVLRLTGRRG